MLEEGAGWLEDALQRSPDPARARAAALTWLAVFSSLRGGFRRGGELFADSIALFAEAGDLPGQARAMAILGFWRAACGNTHADALCQGQERPDRTSRYPSGSAMVTPHRSQYGLRAATRVPPASTRRRITSSSTSPPT
jgi:hypothetical protein